MNVLASENVCNIWVLQSNAAITDTEGAIESVRIKQGSTVLLNGCSLVVEGNIKVILQPRVLSVRYLQRIYQK